MKTGELNGKEHLQRFVEKDKGSLEFSPMDPPDAFQPPALDDVPYEKMHIFLKNLMDEHNTFRKALDNFELVLNEIQTSGVDRGINERLQIFFSLFDHQIIKHQQLEEKFLYPGLKKKLTTAGEHSNSEEQITSIDVMQDDHLKFIQLGAIVFNFFGISSRLPDQNSRLTMLDLAIEQGKNLIELLKLHMFREDYIVFPQANRLFRPEELEEIEIESMLYIK